MLRAGDGVGSHGTEGVKWDTDYFIKKFSAIPDELWITGVLFKEGACCALGHCGWGRVTEAFPREADALITLVRNAGIRGNVADLNDGMHPDFTQPTPKARILAALEVVKQEELSRLKKEAQ